ncbi:MAG: hypothetical protein FJ104_07705 [Deltaproteobacteria bacterium]|nr:hypothetical protein [Deltaproteobacteria bacterium]
MTLPCPATGSRRSRGPAWGTHAGRAPPQLRPAPAETACRQCFAENCCDALAECQADGACDIALGNQEECVNAPDVDLGQCFERYMREVAGEGQTVPRVVTCMLGTCTERTCGAPIVD